MSKRYLMGNEAIALGALAAGIRVVAGYPGTPSSEVIETIAKYHNGSCYVEWSVNEKASMELAAGAAYTGARTLVTMKQVGLNVASDPLMSLSYIGIEGAMVVMVADDPGPISSQTEQDTRTFAAYSKLPCFDPSSVQEAYSMIQEAFEFSAQHKTPVLFRPTTRVCHGYAAIEVKEQEEYLQIEPIGFVKDSSRWVIFPRLSNINHRKIEERNIQIKDIFSNYPRNTIVNGNSRLRKGIATHGFNFTYTMEAMESISADSAVKIFKVATPFPFPEKRALEFLSELDEVLCIEELDPVIERELTYICGKYQLPIKIYGKLTGNIPFSGENSCDSVDEAIKKFLKIPLEKAVTTELPELPMRPPVLCAGCPHRASFYAVKMAMKGRKSLFCGDIGCYTLGNASPLDMTDTCLCMGAGVNIAQGIGKVEPDTACFSFVGDSTFFASAITGVVNAIYNQANMVLVVLDNSTTAMTGHQPHPGTGRTMMGEIVDKIGIESVLRGLGVSTIETINPFNLEEAIEGVKRVEAIKGVKAIIFKAPCIALFKREHHCIITDKCINCKVCIKRLGCPALIIKEGRVDIDNSLCNGCSLCAQVCPSTAIINSTDNI